MVPFLLLVPLISLSYPLPQGIGKPLEMEIVVDGSNLKQGVLVFRETLRFSAQGFREVCSSFASSPEEFLGKFRSCLLERWGDYGAEAGGWTISLTLAEEGPSYALQVLCEVRGSGVILGAGPSPTVSLEWLLGPLGFDLYAFEAEGKEKLRWEGELQGVPMTIVLVFPWPLSHCHYHIWPR